MFKQESALLPGEFASCNQMPTEKLVSSSKLIRQCSPWLENGKRLGRDLDPVVSRLCVLGELK